MLGSRHNLRSARLKARRRKIIIGKVVFVFICLVGLLELVFWVSGLKVVNINNIEVVGISPLSRPDITSVSKKILEGRYLFVISRSNAFFYPKTAIEKSVLDLFPKVESVSVSLKNLHTIEIKAVERRMSALWCQKQSLILEEEKEVCYALDEGGYIFGLLSEINDFATTTVKFYSLSRKENPIRQTYSSAGYFRSLLGLASSLSSIGFNVTTIREKSDTDIEVKLIGGCRLIFSNDANLVSVLNNFQTIISDPTFIGGTDLSKIDYIDLRFGNKVIYKLR